MAAWSRAARLALRVHKQRRALADSALRLIERRQEAVDCGEETLSFYERCSRPLTDHFRESAFEEFVEGEGGARVARFLLQLGGVSSFSSAVLLSAARRRELRASSATDRGFSLFRLRYLLARWLRSLIVRKALWCS